MFVKFNYIKTVLKQLSAYAEVKLRKKEINCNKDNASIYYFPHKNES